MLRVGLYSCRGVEEAHVVYNMPDCPHVAKKVNQDLADYYDRPKTHQVSALNEDKLWDLYDALRGIADSPEHHLTTQRRALLDVVNRFPDRQGRPVTFEELCAGLAHGDFTPLLSCGMRAQDLEHLKKPCSDMFIS